MRTLILSSAVSFLFLWQVTVAQSQVPISNSSNFQKLMFDQQKSGNAAEAFSEADFNSINVKRKIKHWRTGADYSSQTKYYYAAFTDVFEGENLERFLAAGGVELGFAGRYDGGMVYLISTNGKYKEVITVLQQNERFINVSPVLAEDVMAENILENKKMRTLDSSRGTIKAEVTFWENLSISDKTNNIKSFASCDSILHIGNKTIVVTTRSELLKLTQDDNVRFIHEYQPPLPLNDISRRITKVDSLQQGHINITTALPPTIAWNRDSIYTGDSIWIGIAGGMDSTKNDFREQGTGARKALIPGFTNMWGDTGYNTHDTHCAGIAAGNGWMSSLDATKGTLYQYRGVAPKARLANIPSAGPDTRVGDVNSVSYALNTDGVYSVDDYPVDTSIARHDTTRNSNRNNIWVYAAANNGANQGYGIQFGYYSMLVNAKNPIKIGAVEKQTSLRADFSSMGPTRDGRIGPDVMAPGSNSTQEKFHILIDYIRLRGPTGTIKREWNFNNTTENMLPGGYHHDSIRATPTALSLYGGHGVTIRTDSLTSNINAESRDTIEIRFMADDSLAPSFINCKGIARLFTVTLLWRLRNNTGGGDPPFSWNTLTNVYFYGLLNSGWQTIKMKINAGNRAPGENTTGVWPSETGSPEFVTHIALCFQSLSIMSVYANGHTGGYQYIDGKGTSMAAPHAAGIVALMLQKYKDTYNLDIHNKPFWNSTARAILAHTATDIIDTLGLVEGANVDFLAANQKYHPNPAWPSYSTVYTKGPDYATGYGLINAQKAVQYVDRAKFKEDTIRNRETKCFSFSVPAGIANMRATLCWDDPGNTNFGQTTCFNAKLVNDVDIYLIPPNGGTIRPWFLDHSPLTNRIFPANGLDSLITPPLIKNNPATRRRDSLNNLEVVDVVNPVSGIWKVIIEGRSIPIKQSLSGPVGIRNQDISLVTDFQVVVDSTTGFYQKYRTANRAGYILNGNLKLRQCYIAGSLAGFLFRSSGITRASMDTLGNIHATTLSDTSQVWLDRASNLTGGFVFRGPDGRVKMHVSTGGVVRIGGLRKCNSL